MAESAPGLHMMDIFVRLAQPYRNARWTIYHLTDIFHQQTPDYRLFSQGDTANINSSVN